MARFTQESFQMMGALRARTSNGWGASRKSVNYGRLAQKWTKKSLIEGGCGRRPRMCVPPSMNDFSNHFLRQAPIIKTFLREAPHGVIFGKILLHDGRCFKNVKTLLTALAFFV